MAAGATLCGLLAAGCASSGARPATPPAAKTPAAAVAPVPATGAGRSRITVTLVSGAAATTPTARLDSVLARYLPRYLPGHPAVRVDAMGGAGSQAAANFVYLSAPADGTTLLAAADPVTPWVVQDPTVRYDASRFVWVGGVPTVDVQFARASAQIQGAGDLRDYTGTVVLGGLGPARRRDLLSRLYLDLLDVQYRYVTGYGSPAALERAVRSGAVTFAAASISGYAAADLPLQNEGLIVPLSQSGLVDAQGQVEADPRSHLPTDVQIIRGAGRPAAGAEYDALVAVSAAGDVNEALALPPDTPAPVAAAWRQAVRRVFADREFLAAARKSLGAAPSLIPGSEAQAAISHAGALLGQNPGVLTLLRQMASIQPS